MAQLQEVRCLTPEQIETTMKNWFKMLNVKTHRIITSGKPVFSKENEEQWHLPHITKFADKYTLYRCEVEQSDNIKNANKNIDISNSLDPESLNFQADPSLIQPSPLFFIVLETNKFDKLNISACIWYYHLFEDELNFELDRPQVFICPAFVVTDTMTLHVPINVLPCLYRFVSLCELYPMLGSKTAPYCMTYNYRIVKTNRPCNGRDYSAIFSSDCMAKALNTLPGDIIECKRILFEGTAYGEYYRREVINTANDVNIISPSGICDGRKAGKIEVEDEQKDSDM